MYVIMASDRHTGSVAAGRLLDKGKKVQVMGRDSKNWRHLRAGRRTLFQRMCSYGCAEPGVPGRREVYVLIPPAMTLRISGRIKIK